MADLTGLGGLGGLSAFTYGFGGFGNWGDLYLDLTYASGLTGTGTGTEDPGGGPGGPAPGGNPGEVGGGLGPLFGLGGEVGGPGSIYLPSIPNISFPTTVGGGVPPTQVLPPILTLPFPPSTPPTVSGGFPNPTAGPGPQQPPQNTQVPRAINTIGNVCAAAFVVLRALLQGQQPDPNAVRQIQPYFVGIPIPGGVNTVFVPGAPGAPGGAGGPGGGGGYYDPTTGQFVPTGGGFLPTAPGAGAGAGFLPCAPSDLTDELCDMRAELAFIDAADCGCGG